MTYHFIPIDWDNPTLEDARRYFEVMEQSKDKRVLAHCWVNARSSGLVYLYRTIKGGLSEPEERAILSKIWDNNRGYELRNVPKWRAYFKEVHSTLAQ